MKRFILLPVICFLLTEGAIGQEPPASPPPDSGPTLGVTLQFITEKINTIGRISDGKWPGNHHDTMLLSSATGHPDSCTLTYHYLSKLDDDDDGSSKTEGESTIFLREIQSFSVHAGYGGNNGKDWLTGESLIYLEFTFPKGSSSKWWPRLIFYDEAIAGRVGKAFRHAASICATSKEPF